MGSSLLRHRAQIGRATRLAWSICAVSLCLAAPVHAQSVELPNDFRGLDRNLRDLLPEGTNRSGDAAIDRAREEQRLRQLNRVPTDELDGRSTDREEPFSPRERDYSERADMSLRQFGYDIFRPADLQTDPTLTGVVPDDYVLGIGDELIVTMRGQINRTETLRVDREGRILLEDLPPVPAAGLTLGDVRSDIQDRVSAGFLRTDAFVSVGGTRAVRVLVGGEVERPGQRVLTSFGSIVDALIAAGGVRKSGSLRNVRLIRNGEVSRIDLYDLLIGGEVAVSIRLQDGDQLIIPPLGPTAALAGDVVRPGIFELPADDAIQLDQLVAMAGGFQRSRGNRLNLLRLDEAGNNQRVILDRVAGAVRGNDLLLVDRPAAAVELEGAFDAPGRKAVSAAGTLRQLLSQPEVLKADPYLPFALIRTEDPMTRVQRYVPVNLQSVLGGQTNVTLRERDQIIVLGREEIAYLTSADVQSVLRGQTPPVLQIARDEKAFDQQRTLAGAAASSTQSAAQSKQMEREHQLRLVRPWQEPEMTEPKEAEDALAVPNGSGSIVRTDVRCAGLRQLATLVAETGTNRFLAAVRSDPLGFGGSRRIVNTRSCPELFDRHPDLLPLLLEYGAGVEGEIRFPGIYPVVPGSSLEEIVRAAGGLTINADSESLDITRLDGTRQTGQTLVALSGLLIGPGTVVRANPVLRGRESGFVEIAGEVDRPGRLDIRAGERLSEVLRRVGGLGEHAYPYGAVFTRERVRDAEFAANQRAARELEAAIPAALTSAEDATAVRSALPVLQSLAESLRNAPAVGRVVVEADPLVLAARPELDFVLEPGDRLYIPKRPSHVTVTGDVLNPGSVMFTSGLEAEEYIRRVGGLTPNADDGNAFVVLPNGEAIPLRLGAWSGEEVQIPPGSTIVVPRDPRPFDFLTLTRSITSLVSDLAISAASIAVISR